MGVTLISDFKSFGIFDINKNATDETEGCSSGRRRRRRGGGWSAGNIFLEGDIFLTGTCIC